MHHGMVRRGTYDPADLAQILARPDLHPMLSSASFTSSDSLTKHIVLLHMGSWCCTNYFHLLRKEQGLVQCLFIKWPSMAAALFDRPPVSRQRGDQVRQYFLSLSHQDGGLIVRKKFKTLEHFTPTSWPSTNASMNLNHNSPPSIKFLVRTSRLYTSHIVSKGATIQLHATFSSQNTSSQVKCLLAHTQEYVFPGPILGISH